MDPSVAQLAHTVSERMQMEGIHVHWDDAHTTGSVYLDLDYGLLGTVRVSDHKSKGNGFQLEVGYHIRERHKIIKDFHGTSHTVHKFPDSDVDGLTEEVMIRRLRLKAKVGNSEYARSIEEGARHCAGREVHPPSRRRKPRARVSD